MTFDAYGLIETVGGVALAVIAAVVLFMFAVSLVDRHPGSGSDDAPAEEDRVREP